MAPPSVFSPGDPVHTPLGKGIVRESRGGGRVAVEVRGRMVVFPETAIGPADVRKARAKTPRPLDEGTRGAGAGRRVEVDLHGLTVHEAIERLDTALNDALASDAAELLVIHGRSGGRLRAAVHQRLRSVGAVRGFRVDPRNAGATIVSL